MRERIGNAMAGLSKKERSVAEYVLEHPSAVLFATVAEVARRAGVVPATVVRFAQSIGFAGYVEFRDALRSEFPSLRTPLDRLDEDMAGAQSGQTGHLVERVRAQTSANLDRTFAQLDVRLLDAALEYLLAARRTLVVGTGQSRVLAMHLHWVLQTAGIPSQVIEDWFDLTYGAPTLRPDDVVFGITVWSYARMTIEAVRLARRAGVRSILLTDASFAPGTDAADITLLFSPQAIGEYLSPAAGAALIDCLMAGLAARVPERVKSGITTHQEIIVAHGLTYR